MNDQGPIEQPESSDGIRPEEAVRVPVTVAEADTKSEADQEVERLLGEDAPVEQLKPHVEEQDAPEAADTIESLDKAEQVALVHEMDNTSAAEALVHMDAALAATVLFDLDEAESVELIELMEPDDAADLLQKLPAERRAALLATMHPRRAAVLAKLALYDPESAGGIMTTDIVVLRSGQTIGQAIDRIKKQKLRDDQPYIYVVDDMKRLLGTISLRELLIVDDDEAIADHIDADIDSVLPETDREEVAKLFERYDYLTMPVVDQNRRILGMITIDDVIDIIAAETTEDALKQVGAGSDEQVISTIRAKLKGRLPWLAVNLGTASMAAAAVLPFQDAIELIPVVAVIFPIIANQAGNTGFQSLAVTLRGLVLGEIRKDRIRPLFLRELAFGLLSGATIGVIVFLLIIGLGALGRSMDIGLFSGFSWRLGLVAGAAMNGVMIVGCVVGTAVPLVMKRLGADPAAASSIFLIMLTDMFSFATFLGMVYVLRDWLINDTGAETTVALLSGLGAMASLG
ncbi:MAG: magnesium transporter [Phycisphaerales bacterium JB065]